MNATGTPVTITCDVPNSSTKEFLQPGKYRKEFVLTVSTEGQLPDGAAEWVISVVGEKIRSCKPVRSNEINRVFGLVFDHHSLFLKIGPGLEREYEKLRWLTDRAPCPRPVGFTRFEKEDALLMTAIDGEDLAELSAALPPERVIGLLAQSLLRLHATPVHDWHFGDTDEGSVLVHGDACLPNFLYRDGQLTGYVDLGDLSVAEREVDLSAAVWSLQYNLGPGYGLSFLREYGLTDADETHVEALRLQYEQG